MYIYIYIFVIFFNIETVFENNTKLFLQRCTITSSDDIQFFSHSKKKNVIFTKLSYIFRHHLHDVLCFRWFQYCQRGSW